MELMQTMGRIHNLNIFILTAALFFAEVGLAFSQSSVKITGDVENGAVPRHTNFYGRLNRDGAPYTGNTSVIMKIYKSETANGDCKCIEGETCSQENVLQVAGCLWQSKSKFTKVVQGLFRQDFEIPAEVLGISGLKYYEILADGVPVLLGSSNKTRKAFDTYPYAYISGTLEEKAIVRLSTLTVANGGNIYLNYGKIVFAKKGVITEQSSSTVNLAIDTLQGDADVFANALDNISLFTSCPNDINTNCYNAMNIRSNGNISIGSNNVDANAKLHVYSNIPNQLKSSDMRIVGELFGNSESNELSLKGIKVNRIYGNGGITKGGITIKEEGDTSLTFQSPNLLVANDVTQQLFLRQNGVYIGSKFGILNAEPSYNSLLVKDSVYASDGIYGRNVYVSTHSEIYSTNNKMLLQQGNNNSVLVGIVTAAPANGNKLRVGGGLRTDNLLATGKSEFQGTSNFFGNFDARQVKNEIHLSSTIIHGSLNVTGNSAINKPAYLDKENIFLQKQNFNKFATFGNGLFIENSLITNSGVSAFTSGKYLQVGDNSPAYSNKNTSLKIRTNSAGSFNFRSNVNTEIGKIAIANSSNALSFATDASLIEISDDVYAVPRGGFSAKQDGARGLYASINSPVFFGEQDTIDHSADSAVVNGQLAVNSLRFPDGSTMSSSYAGNPNISSISNTGKVVVETSNGSIRLQNSGTNVMVVAPNGNVGIGLSNPAQQLALPSTETLMVGDVFFADSAINVKAKSISSGGSIKANTGFYLNNTQVLNSSGAFNNLSWNGSPIPVSKGGTGRNYYPAGQTLHGNGEGAINTANVNLSSEVENSLPVANGGTASSVYSASGSIGVSGSTIGVVLLDISQDVQGVLPIANGGLGLSSIGVGILHYESGSIVLKNIDAAGQISNNLPVSNGGFASNIYSSGIPYAASANSTNILASANFAGNILLGTSGAPTNKPNLIIRNINKTFNSANNEIVFSIPQSVRPETVPTFAGLSLVNGNTYQNQILGSNASGNIVVHTVVLADNLTSTLPVKNGGTGNISLPAGLVRFDGNKFISGANTISLAAETGGQLPAANGGTGIGSYTAGDFFAASSNTELGKATLLNGYTIIGKTGSMPVASNISGTSSQVNIGLGYGSITLSLPQSINKAAIPAFSGLTLTSLNGFVKGNGANELTAQQKISLTSDIAGLLSIANGGTGVNGSSFGNGIIRSNGIRLENSLIALNSAGDVENVLAIANGGLGTNLYGNTSGILRIDGNASVSKAVLNSDSQDLQTGTVLGISNGGTGLSTLPAGVLHSNGSSLSSSAVKLNSEVSGTLPISNGGTGINFINPNMVLATDSRGNLSAFSLTNYSLLGGKSQNIDSITLTAINNGTEVLKLSNNELRVKFIQDLSASGSPVFAGLSLTDPNTLGGILFANSSGIISTRTLVITDYITGTAVLSVAKGGTGRAQMSAGPIISSAGSIIDSGLVSLSSHIKGILPVEKGGTGSGFYSTGSLLYAESAESIAGLQLGLGQTLIGGSTALQASGLTGTENQVIVTGTTGTSRDINLSLPQSIDENAVPTFAGLTLTGKNGILYADSSNSYAVSTKTIDLVGDTAGTLGLANGGTGAASLTGLMFASGGSFISSSIDLSQHITGVLPVAYNGTGLSSLTINALLTAGSSNQLNSELVITSGKFLYKHNSSELTSGSFIPVDNGANSINVNTNSEGITIETVQDLSETATVKFSSVTVSGDLTALHNVKATNTASAQVMTVDMLTMENVANIPVVDKCRYNFSGEIGEIAFCRNRQYNSSGSSNPLNRLIYYDGEKWCCFNGKQLCDSNICWSNCYGTN